MGHDTDKLYITHSEHSGLHGQHTASTAGARKKQAVQFARLPFDCCALTLKPFETPVATTDGNVYELLAIIPYLKKHGTDPVTGKKLSPGDLVSLNFSKNAEDAFHDPVTFKVFSEHTPLVAIKTSGNVYTKETVDRLNIKANHWHDLVDDTPFTRSDIILIQDPSDFSTKDRNNFDYVKRDLKADVATSLDSLSGINVGATGVGKLMKQIAGSSKTSTGAQTSDAAAAVDKPPPAKKAKTSASSGAPKPYNSSHVSTNRAAAALTSTTAGVYTTSENALWHEEDLMFEAVQQKGEKGFVRLVTNYGNINLELFCAAAPKTCYNFLRLAAEDKYANTIFHRLIPGFMIQGGDPTGTGRGGASCWGKPFSDEYSLRGAKKHDDRGIVSMANSGPNTNGSQFFVTFRATEHLNGKHTVFGRLVGGEDVLNKLEKVPVDPATNRPLKNVVLEDVEIFQDPFAAYQERLSAKLQREAEERAGTSARQKKAAERAKDRTTWFGTNLGKKDESAADKAIKESSGVGKYLATGAASAVTGSVSLPDEPEVGKKKRKSNGWDAW